MVPCGKLVGFTTNCRSAPRLLKKLSSETHEFHHSSKTLVGEHLGVTLTREIGRVVCGKYSAFASSLTMLLTSHVLGVQTRLFVPSKNPYWPHTRLMLDAAPVSVYPVAQDGVHVWEVAMPWPDMVYRTRGGIKRRSWVSCRGPSGYRRHGG